MNDIVDWTNNTIDWAVLVSQLIGLVVGVFLGFIWGRSTQASHEAHQALDLVTKLNHDSAEPPTPKKTEEPT